MTENLSPDATSARLLEMAETFARQGRPAMAEAARRAAVSPSPPISWRPATPRPDASDAGPRWVWSSTRRP